MTACEALRLEAEWSYGELTASLKDISQELSWAQVIPAPGKYLHTNGTIIGLVHHISVCKIMYGSTAFRNTEIRWRDCIARLEAIGTDWQETLTYLEEAHRYWIGSWQQLNDDDLDRESMHFRGVLRPTWRLIGTVTHHDGYHGGQINLLASTLVETDTPPDMHLDEERKAVIDLPGW